MQAAIIKKKPSPDEVQAMRRCLFGVTMRAGVERYSPDGQWSRDPRAVAASRECDAFGAVEDRLAAEFAALPDDADWPEHLRALSAAVIATAEAVQRWHETVALVRAETA